MADSRTLAHLLSKHIETSTTQKTIGFDGCGVTHGVMGVIFGTGLDEHCQQVIAQVEAEIKKGNKVTLNAYGHSRGAIAALMLAKQLGAIDPQLLEINLALLDPVPGNLITTSTLDWAGISLAKKTMDLRACKPLKNVLTLYPHQPLPTLAVHAPLFSLYPEHTKIDEDVIAGCHSGAQFQYYDANEVHFKRDSFITFARIVKFLQDCGTQFKPFPELSVADMPDLRVSTNALEPALLSVYQAENEAYHEKTTRSCHSATGVYINTKSSADFFNVHHQRLAGISEDKSRVRVTIEENHDPVSQLKRTMLHYPKTWQMIKWSLLSIGVASLIFFTGGLGIIPVLTGVIAKLGMLSIVASAPIVGGVLASLWYGGIKPLSQWAINRFFYPKFDIRHIEPVEEVITGSPQRLMANLGVPHRREHTLLEREKRAEPYQHPSIFATPASILAEEDEKLNSIGNSMSYL
ncbi:hypothetical protein LOR_71c20390 [Legionella oakridgensis RV-2-2007]|nr:hypothetical protein LOR_71c20390 [Legionella oakridgensis RV-2-2007]